MKYNILHYIITVSEEENFTKAAKKLYITQPSLSQIIKNEEDRLGVLLFERNRPITLTPAGHEYVLWARQVLALNKKMEIRLNEFSTNKISVIKIGILPECSAFILPIPLKEFRENNPDAIIQINELSNSDLQKVLKTLNLTL